MDLAWTCQITRRTSLGPTAWTRREAYGTNAHVFLPVFAQKSAFSGYALHMDLTWTDQC